MRVPEYERRGFRARGWLIGLAVVVGSGLLTLVRERIRLGTVRWNPFSRNRL